MLSKDEKICLVLRSKEEIGLFSATLEHLGYTHLTMFENPTEAYEVISRKQFDIFFIRMETAPMSGIVLIQKMRATGNYGHESQFFITDAVHDNIVHTLAEFDVHYVLVKPFTPQRIEAKFVYMLRTEQHLSDSEKAYRDARSALHTNLIEMAEQIGMQLLRAQPENEKYIVLMSDVELRKKNPTASRELLLKALERNPNSILVNYKIGVTYNIDGLYPQAAEHLNKVADVSPYNIKLLENAGLCNYQLGNEKVARKYVEQLRTVDTTNKGASELLSTMAIRSKDYDSVQHLLKYTHSDLEIVAYLNNQGIELSKQKRFSDALHMYHSCLPLIEASKHAYIVYYNMALNFSREGNFKEATNFLHKTFEVNPEFEKAKDLMQKIQKRAS